MTKRFGSPTASPAKVAKDGSYTRLMTGFLGTTWDGTGIAFEPNTWIKVNTPVRKGGFLAAFGSPRTEHRIICAIEDAGNIIQDKVLYIYGSGWPKRRDQLKPAYEPIVLSYKPGGPRTMQIDECRIPTDELQSGMRGGPRSESAVWNQDTCGLNSEFYYDGSKGRWPANIVHSGDDEVMAMFAEFGDHKGGACLSGNEPSVPLGGAVYGGGLPRMPFRSYDDSGSPARFFYSAKATPDERYTFDHPTMKNLSLMRWLVRLICPKGGTILDPFGGTGTTGIAAMLEGRNAILIEQEPKYVEMIHERLAFYRGEAYRQPKKSIKRPEGGLIDLIGEPE